MLKRWTFFIAIIFMSAASLAEAQLPDAVKTAYKAYSDATAQGDSVAAENHARDAWEAAEESLGDHKTTGDLAFNYAYVAMNNKSDARDIGNAFERSIKLLNVADKDTALESLKREVDYGYYLRSRKRYSKMARRFKKAEQLAERFGLQNTTFMAELLTFRAEAALDKSDYEDGSLYAERALATFKNQTDDIASPLLYFAKLYLGYGKEGEEELIPALLAYQDLLTKPESEISRRHPLSIRAFGRWSYIRHRLVRDGLRDEALAAGMCNCWPYDVERNEDTLPIKRTAPKMPSNAYSSGFSIVEFDLNDDGTTKNIKILESWPPDLFEVSSERAVQRWEYKARTVEQTDADRKGLITTIRYQLADSRGRMIE